MKLKDHWQFKIYAFLCLNESGNSGLVLFALWDTKNSNSYHKTQFDPNGKTFHDVVSTGLT